jgi:hypothetical protein
MIDAEIQVFLSNRFGRFQIEEFRFQIESRNQLSQICNLKSEIYTFFPAISSIKE